MGFFPEFIRIAGQNLLVNTISNKQFEPDFDDLISKIDDSVKGVIINSPSNPTGGVWSDEAISKLLKLSKEKIGLSYQMKHMKSWFMIMNLKLLKL